MKYLKPFEKYGATYIDFESKAREIEEEKAKTENLRREKEVQKLKNQGKVRDKQLKDKVGLFKNRKVA